MSTNDGTTKFSLLVAAGVVAISAFAWWRRPQPSSILEVEPLDRERAVVVRRDARAGSPVSYVQLVDRDGIRWEHELRGATVFPDPFYRMARIVETSNAVVVRSRVNHAPALDAFDAGDGRALWHVEPMTGERDPRGLGFDLLDLSLAAEGGTVFAFYGRELVGGEDDFVRVLAFDARSGALRWKSDVRGALGAVGPAWLRGRSLVLFTANALVVFDTQTGRMRARFDADPQPCVTASQAWFTWGGELHVLALEGLSERTVPRPIDDPLQLHGGCAMRGGWLWLAASDRYGETRGDNGRVGAFAPSWMIALDPNDGSLQAQFELGRVRVGSPGDDRGHDSAPDTMPLSGEPPRYVPLTVRDVDHPPHVVMLDLDARRIAWQTAPDERMTHGQWQRHGAMHYLLESRSRLFAAIDGETGGLTGAVVTPPLEMPKVTGDRIWIRDGWNVANVDARTLAPVWSSGNVALPDARADAEKLFDQGSR